MDFVLFYLAALTCLGCFVVTLELVIGLRRIPFLCNISPDLPETTLRISVIIAARNEASGVEQALQSVLTQAYPDSEVIVVNDRSTDGTGDILDRIARQNNRLRVIHNTDLPPGWLGKNHALHIGAQHATGTYFLFTDADVVMQPDTLSRALAYVQTHDLDHLALCPETRHTGILLPILSCCFFLNFLLYFRPWHAPRQKSRCYIGLGAFNLVHQSAYRAVGGHETLRLQVVDDVLLGKIIKRAGFKQALLFGTGQIWLTWYPTLSAMVGGLTKNMFAGLQYRVWGILIVSLGTLVFVVFPYIALFFTHGSTFWFYLLSVVLMTWHYQDVAAFINQKRWYALAYPIAALLLTYVQLRSMVLTLKQRGVVWRDTFYPLSELKKHVK